MPEIWEFLKYISFSTFEGFAVFALSLFIYRYNFFGYFWLCLVINVVINLQSYFIRNELSLVSISPVLNLLITILFVAIFIRVPLIGATIMSLTGFAAYFIVQSLLIIGFEQSGINMDQLRQNQGLIYLIQTLTGTIGIVLGWILYKFGYGFSYPFLRKRFKGEKPFIVVSLCIFLLSLIWMMYVKAVFTNLYITSLSLIVFLCYSFRKEAGN